MSRFITVLEAAAQTLALALAVLIIGSFAIKKLIRALANSRLIRHMESTAQGFTLSFIQIAAYLVLGVSVISILGVPMASIIAVLASSGVAVGMALQGSLSNLAAGIMLMFFKPFKQGDYIEAANTAGFVQELTLFYTFLLTMDNKKIIIPNGTLMNTTVTNWSSEAYRRVDIAFTCSKAERPSETIARMMAQLAQCPKVSATPAAPAVHLSATAADSYKYVLSAWCLTGDYWQVYYQLLEQVTEALLAAGLSVQAVRVIADETSKK